jgi:hypothetical protein
MNIALTEIAKTLKEQKKYWIVFTGDSITSCEWVHPNWRDIIIYVLQDQLTGCLNGDWQTAEWGIKGFNFAYDGATTKNIVEKINDLLLIKPNLIISLMGGNDSVLGISVEDSINNIKTIAKKAIEIKTKLVWCSSTPAKKGSKKNQEYQPYSDAFLKADLKNVIKIDMFNLFNNFPTEKFFTFISEENPVENIKAGDLDLQHPNQLGNAYIAKVILKEIFNIEFNPEIYMQDTLSGEKYPKY